MNQAQPQAQTQEGLDLFGKPAPRIVTGRQLKRRGQDAALKRAGNLWRDKIMTALRAWVLMKDTSGNQKTTFVMEDFREYCRPFQALKPVSANAWGSLPKIALSAGLIERTEQMARSRRVSAHGRMVHLWRVK
jgi:hypothetical protein